MFGLWIIQVVGLLLLAVPSVLGSIISVLATFDELSTLNSYINASQSLSKALLAASNDTFIAPSNAAFEAFLGELSPTKPTEDAITKLLLYHFLVGGYPGALFTTTPRFVPSHLPNGNYANVTGGQVVEILRDANGNPQFISGNKTISPIVEQDLLFSGGIIHIVDKMLAIPPSPVVELTEAHLDLGIALINDAGLLTAAARNTVASIFDVQDVTIFMPNSQLAIASFHAMSAVNSSTTRLAEIFNYHQIPNVVGYSHVLENGSTWRTGQGRSVKVTVEGNDTFIDGAKIIGKDYLIANGVMHIIDDALNPFNATTPPVTASNNGVSHTVLGASLTFAFLLPVCAGITFFWWFTKRRRTAFAEIKEIDFGGDRAYAQQVRIPVSMKNKFELEDSSPISSRGVIPQRFPPPPPLPPPPAVYTLYPGQSRVEAVELDAGSVRRV